MKRTPSVSLLLLLVTGALVVVLVSVFTLSAMDAFDRERESSHVLASAKISRDIVSVREALRVELGVIDTTLSEPDAANRETLQKLALLHGKANAALILVEQEMAAEARHQIMAGLAGIQKRQVTYSGLFPRVMAEAKRPRSLRSSDLASSSNLASKSIYDLVDAIDVQAVSLSARIAAAGPFLSEMMKVGDIAWHIRADAGDDRRTLATLMQEAHAPTIQRREHLADVSGRINAPWQTIVEDARQPSFPENLRAAVARANSVYFGSYRTLRRKIIEGLASGRPLQIAGPQWLLLSNPALNSLMDVCKVALKNTEAQAVEQLDNANRQLFVSLGLMLFSIGLASLAAIIVLGRVILPLKEITRAVKGLDQQDLHPVPLFQGRNDEIGEFAQALDLFRAGAAERQRLENELLRNQAAKEAAETSSRIKSEFLANMSHELRTPLNAVIGFSDLMLHKTFGPLSERYGEYAQLINGAGNHLLNLVSDILDLAKIEAGKFTLDFQHVDLKTIVDHSLQLVKPRADAHRVALRTVFPDGPIAIEADARACRQILINLLSNAVKFVRDGGEVEVSVAASQDAVCITVSDNGIGIPASALPRIGQAFEQASNNPMLAREGTGLGLALVRALVGEHGGSLQVDSQEHVGTRVTIRLPRLQQRRRAA